jgi:hypothetical protein
MANAAEMRIGLGVSPRHPGVAPTVLSMLQSARRRQWWRREGNRGRDAGSRTASGSCYLRWNPP